MQLEEKRTILQYLWGFYECIISFPPPSHITQMFRAQIPVPSWASSLTHGVEPCAQPQAVVCGLPGWSLGRQVAFQEGDRGRASWPFCKHSHTIQYSSGCGGDTSLLLSSAKAKIGIQGASWFRVFVYFLSVSFRSRITC